MRISATSRARPTRSTISAWCTRTPRTSRPPPPATGTPPPPPPPAAPRAQAHRPPHPARGPQDPAHLQAAPPCHRQALALARAAGARLAEAVSITDLGQVQQLSGDYPAAIASHTQALAMFRSLDS